MFKNSELNNLYNNININETNKCLICLDKLDYDKLKLSCSHNYHAKCLFTSFSKYISKKCPYCNKIIILNNYINNCSVIKNTNQRCNKITYNDSHICNYHIKLKINKNKKNKLKFINKIKKINNKIINLIDKLNDHLDDKNEILKKMKNENDIND